MKAWLLDESGKKFYVHVLDREKLLCLADPIRLSILEVLCEKPMYVKELSERLGLKLSIVYYHVKKLLDAGLVKYAESVKVRGTLAHKLMVSSGAYAYLLSSIGSKEEVLLSNLVKNTILERFYRDIGPDFTLIVGSAEPHGAFRARSYDHRYAIELAFFLGKLAVRGSLKTRLDTEVRDDELRGNIILIGGPVVNTISYRLNDKLPIKFIPQEDNAIYSTITGKSYREDSNGVIELIDNPFNLKSKVLVLAGKRLKGTEAAVFALINNLSEVSKGNIADENILAHVVEGFDLDGDGAIDYVEIME